jgi:LPS sulfotransferase NodH
MNALALIRPSRASRDAIARAVLRLRSLSGSDNYRRFVVVGIARTGSTLLVNLLNDHSRVLAFGELFRSPETIGWDIAPFNTLRSAKLLALYSADPVVFIDECIFRRWPRGWGAVGFKLFYYHARQLPFSRVWEYLAANRDIRILHIKRRNILEQYYSLQQAHKTNVWASSKVAGANEQPPLRLEIDACRQHFTWVRCLEDDCTQFFKAHEMKEVYYEDLAANSGREMKGVQDFLGLDHERLSVKMARQRRRPLSDAIVNYAELKCAFEDTPWAGFFEDPAD